MNEAVRVYLAEASPFVVRFVEDLVASTPEIELIGSSGSWPRALADISGTGPDVVLLASRLGRNGAGEMARELMEKSPVASIIITGRAPEEIETTFEAIRAGAIDFLLKPEMPTTINLEHLGPELMAKIFTARKIRVIRRVKTDEAAYSETVKIMMNSGDGKLRPQGVCPARNLVAIGVSTGGPPVVQEILSSLPDSLPAAIVIAQHMPRGFAEDFASLLNRATALEVRIPRNGERLVEGVAYLAAGDCNVSVQADGTLALIQAEGGNAYTPSVDLLFSSVASNFKGIRIGVILTGMGEDGARGAQQIKRSGGRVIAQSRDTCTVFGMPGAAMALNAVDFALHPWGISRKIVEILGACQTGGC